MVAMAVTAQSQTRINMQLKKHMIITECSVAKTMELKWVRRKRISKNDNNSQLLLSPPVFPIQISTDPRHVDPHRLRNLFSTCNHSCHRFPNDVVAEEEEEAALDIDKLRIALSHSAVLVSVFCKRQHMGDDDDDDVMKMSSSSSSSVMGLLQSVAPVTASDGELVGFGRAVSDLGLTASIYDVTVIPSLRRMGIGKMIVKKIVRMLTNRDIYDIAALCSENERLFFKACGFGSDVLSSTTMMYTRTASLTSQDDERTFTRAGRKLLLVPPLKRLYKSSRTTV